MFCVFGNAMESEEKREHYIIQYYVHWGLSAADTIKEIRGEYGDQCLSKATICRWHEVFGKEWNLTELIPHTRQPKMMEQRSMQIPSLIADDPHISTRQLLANPNISQTTIVQIMKELGMRRVLSI